MKKSFQAGFTLVELLIVLAIMGILATIAAPNYQTYMAQRRLNGASRQVMSDLRRCPSKLARQRLQRHVRRRSEGGVGERQRDRQAVRAGRWQADRRGEIAAAGDSFRDGSRGELEVSADLLHPLIKMVKFGN